MLEKRTSPEDRFIREYLLVLAAAFGGAFTCKRQQKVEIYGWLCKHCTAIKQGFLSPLADLWKTSNICLRSVPQRRDFFRREVIPEGIFSNRPPAQNSLPNQAVDEGKRRSDLCTPTMIICFRAFVERWDRATPEDIPCLVTKNGNPGKRNLGCETGIVPAFCFPAPSDFYHRLRALVASVYRHRSGKAHPSTTGIGDKADEPFGFESPRGTKIHPISPPLTCS